MSPSMTVVPIIDHCQDTTNNDYYFDGAQWVSNAVAEVSLVVNHFFGSEIISDCDNDDDDDDDGNTTNNAGAAPEAVNGNNGATGTKDNAVTKQDNAANATIKGTCINNNEANNEANDGKGKSSNNIQYKTDYDQELHSSHSSSHTIAPPPPLIHPSPPRRVRSLSPTSCSFLSYSTAQNNYYRGGSYCHFDSLGCHDDSQQQLQHEQLQQQLPQRPQQQLHPQQYQLQSRRNNKPNNSNYNNSNSNNNPNKNNNNNNSNYSPITYQPYYHPQDFHTQTWLNALSSSQPTTLRALAGGAAVLTAVIIIHPLALIGGVGAAVASVGAVAGVAGAAGVASVGATAVWAVGFFQDLDGGYRLFLGEEFGRLFWEDEPCGGGGGGIMNGDGNDGDGGFGKDVAIVTSGSKEIIEKDEECLRRVYWMERERMNGSINDGDNGNHGRRINDNDVGNVNTVDNNKSGNKLELGLNRGQPLGLVKIKKEQTMHHLVENAKQTATSKLTKKEVPQSKPIGKSGILTAKAVVTKQSQGQKKKEGNKGGKRRGKTSGQESRPKLNNVQEQQQQQRQRNCSDTNELRRIQSAPVKPIPSSYPLKVSLDELLDPSIHQHDITSPPPPPLLPLSFSSNTSTISNTSTNIANNNSNIPTKTLINRHYPPLEIQVVHEVELPGLHTAEFFRVFFADNAPYSMRDFQKKSGDVDVVYGKWKEVDVELLEKNVGGGGTSFKEGMATSEPLLAPPPKSTQERTLTFNTLTKSYFGPAYAKATKIQRATQLSNHLLVIENKTSLADIPFSDRFHIIERWTIEAVRNDEQQHTDGTNNSSSALGVGQDMALYTSKLTVHAEVVMLKSCPWESQIRKKASETFTEVVTEWCQTARAALEATKQQKQKRLKQSTNINTATAIDPSSRTMSPLPSPSALQSELFAKHLRNFQELDKRIAKGDLEYCSIEVMHSFDAGKQNSFSQVLEFSDAGRYDHVMVGKSLTDATDDTAATESTNGSAREEEGRRNKKLEPRMSMMKRKLLRKISSKVIRSGGKSR